MKLHPRTILRVISALAAIALVGAALSACGPKEPPKKVVKEEPVDPVMSKTADEWFAEGVAQLQAEVPNYQAAAKRFENTLVRDEGYTDAHLNLGLIYEKTAAWDKAIEHYQKAIAQRGEEDASVYIALGRAQLGKGDGNAALEAFRNALTRDDKSMDAMNGMALAYKEAGKFDQAEKMSKEVLTLDSQNLVALNTLGLIYQAQDKPAVAQYIFERANTAQPNNAHVLNNLGLIAYQQKRIPKAVEYFLSAIEVRPDFVPARLNVGAIYLDYLDYASAKEQFEAAYSAWPESPAAHLGYAASLYGNGDYEMAAELYESYAEKHPDAEQPAARLSKLYERQLADPQKACTWYRKLVEFRPDDKELKAVADFTCKNAE